MAWIVQQYEDEVHIVPDTEAGHVLARDCFCLPVVDELDDRLWKHRDELNRLVYEGSEDD